MQPKSRIGAALFFLLLAATCGCSSAPTSVPVVEKMTLRVACPAGPAAQVVREYCKAWQARNDAIVEVTEYGEEGPDSTRADAWVIAAAELGRWAAADKLLSIPGELRQQDDRQEKVDTFGWKGLLPLYRDDLLEWDITTYALPVLGEAPLACYRNTLFKEAGLPPPATWKDVEEAAAFFAKKWGKPSLPPLPADDDSLEREFYTIAAGYVHQAVTGKVTNYLEAYSFHYDLATNPPRVRIDGPGFVHALALMQRLQAYRSQSKDTPAESFRKGESVFCLTDAAQVYRLQHKGSEVRGKFAVMRTPSSEVYFAHDAKAGAQPARAGVGGNWMPYLGAGSWLSVVPKSSGHVEEAFSLLAELGGREVSRQVVLSPRVEPARGGGAFRGDHFDRYARWEVFDLDATRTEELKRVVQATLEHTSVANPVYRLRTPDERQHRAALIKALRTALENPASDPAAALAGVAADWKKITEKNPKFLEEYRLAIGLSRK